MKQANILYEPTPIGRIGLRSTAPGVPFGQREVVIGTDFSCFAYMLQEYISYGIVSILIPSSLPEASAVNQMPPMLRERVRVVSDVTEIETVARLLFPIRRTFNIEHADESGYLTIPNQVPHDLRENILQIHDDLKRLAFGFNHGVQIELNSKRFSDSLYGVRLHTSDTTVRSVLSQLEGILRYYDTVAFDAQVPSAQTPSSLISLLDNLINNHHYIEYSELIDNIATPANRRRTLAKLRELSRLAKSKQILATGWDFTTKILKVWTGVPLPESRELASMTTSRTLPPLVNMDNAHERAVEAWRVFGATNKPLQHDQSIVDVDWLPPLPSMRVAGRATQLGTVQELVDQVQAMEARQYGQ